MYVKGTLPLPLLKCPAISSFPPRILAAVLGDSEARERRTRKKVEGASLAAVVARRRADMMKKVGMGTTKRGEKEEEREAGSLWL